MSNTLACPVCKGMNSKTVDSRSYDSGTGIRRRRACGGCGHRFQTVETIIGYMKNPAKPIEYQKALSLIEQASLILAGKKQRIGNSRITFTAEMDACLKDCHAQGLAVQATADRIGVCHTVVNRRKRELGIEPLKPHARHRAAKALEQTHCKRGHEFTPENTRSRGAGRACRQCDREHKEEYRAKQRAAPAYDVRAAILDAQDAGQ